MQNLRTVRTSNSRQKKGQNRPVEAISVSEMRRHVEFWVSETQQLSVWDLQISHINRFIYPNFFSIPYFSYQIAWGLRLSFLSNGERGKASKRLFHIYLTAPGIKETKCERVFCCKHRKWRSSSTIGEQPFLSTNDAMLRLFYLNSSQKHYHFTISQKSTVNWLSRFSLSELDT